VKNQKKIEEELINLTSPSTSTKLPTEEQECGARPLRGNRGPARRQDQMVAGIAHPTVNPHHSR